MKQSELFQPALPDGFEYVPSFISIAEEMLLLAAIAELPLKEARYKSYTAKRRMVSFGSSYDFDENQLLPAPPLPTFLFSLRAKVADWLAIVPSELAHAMVAEYRPGTALGWHRDAPNFQAVAGISLAGSCRMRLRPFPPRPNKREGVISLNLEPRSAYAMRGSARWAWQHSIPATKFLRYSITFRTLRPAALVLSHLATKVGR